MHGILQGIHPVLPVPKPIYASTSIDEHLVGTAFIVMEFVEVCLAKLHNCIHIIIDCCNSQYALYTLYTRLQLEGPFIASKCCRVIHLDVHHKCQLAYGVQFVLQQ